MKGGGFIAIYTRFGGKVTIVAADLEKGFVDIRRDDGSIMHTYLNELKADDGFKEIEEASKDVPLAVENPQR